MSIPFVDQVTEVSVPNAARLMRLLTDAGNSVFLWGKPGIGKTDIVHQMGAATGRKVIEFHAGLREPVDLRGIPVADLQSATTRWLVPSELPQAERLGRSRNRCWRALMDRSAASKTAATAVDMVGAKR